MIRAGVTFLMISLAILASDQICVPQLQVGASSGFASLGNIYAKVVTKEYANPHANPRFCLRLWL